MPWHEATIMDQRIRFVVLASQPGANLAQLCATFGISRPTGYLWRQRYEQGGFAALADLSHRPTTSPTQTPAALEERVIALRQQYGWGAKKLACLLGPEEQLTVPTINRILKRRGLIAARDSHPPAVQRFERAQPNELWQMDFKGQLPCREGWCYPLSVLDDHSRFALCVAALPSTHGDGVWASLVTTFRTYGLPQAMLMDRGEPWWGSANPYGLSTLSVRLLEQDIQLVHGAVAHPQTQGKVERFHRTLEAAVRQIYPPPHEFAGWAERLAAFHLQYNTVRPHEALGMATPASRYRPSTRPYAEQPPAWVYPTDVLVRTVDQLGMLSEQGERYFVCDALHGKQVGVEVVGTRLLVRYRRFYIREIDTLTKRSTPLYCHLTPDATL